jgi:predicted lipoprotein
MKRERGIAPPSIRTSQPACLLRRAVRRKSTHSINTWIFEIVCMVCVAAAVLPALAAEAEGGDGSYAKFLHNVITAHFAPQAAAFAHVAPKLVQSVENVCQSPGEETLAAARAAWIETMLAWEPVSAIEIGPLIEHRTARLIDFWPVRPPLIEFALREPPTTAAELDRISAPAKGLPALEWLLGFGSASAPVVTKSSAHCAYALVLAQGVAEEARLLDSRFQALAVREFSDEAAFELFTELLNQTVGGLEHLWEQGMEKPARGATAANFSRALSGQTLKAWLARWKSIQDVLVSERRGQDETLEALLRARGSPAVANKLRSATERAGQVLQGVAQATPVNAQKAARALRALQKLVEDEVAPALKVTIGFHEFDGD